LSSYAVKSKIPSKLQNSAKIATVVLELGEGENLSDFDEVKKEVIIPIYEGYVYKISKKNSQKTMYFISIVENEITTTP
jgi:hypothetical protein